MCQKSEGMGKWEEGRKTQEVKEAERKKTQEKHEGQQPPSDMPPAPDSSQRMLPKPWETVWELMLCVNVVGPQNPDIWSNISLAVAVKVSF